MPSTKPHSSWSEGDGEVVGEKKAPASSRLKRNCSKWWWLYFLIFIVIAIVIVIPIIFVGIPKIAQRSLDRATVTVDYQSLTNPTANTFDLQINTTVESHSSRHATIKGFNASFYLLDTKPDVVPFIYAPFPQVETANVNMVNVTARQVPIANMEQFIAYNRLVLESEEFQVGVRGNTHVVLAGLPKYGVTYDKVVTMKGFNKFAGFNIDSIQFHTPAEFDGATMTGRVSIPNPSVISAQFGNVTMDLYTNGTYLGYSLLQYVDYRPGPNTYDMRSYINTTLALEYVQNYVLDLEIRGNSSVNFIGQHLTYFEEALRNNIINYQLNITRALYGQS